MGLALHIYENIGVPSSAPPMPQHNNCLVSEIRKIVLLCTYDICFGGEIRLIIFKYTLTSVIKPSGITLRTSILLVIPVFFTNNVCVNYKKINIRLIPLSHRKVQTIFVVISPPHTHLTISKFLDTGITEGRWRLRTH